MLASARDAAGRLDHDQIIRQARDVRARCFGTQRNCRGSFRLFASGTSIVMPVGDRDYYRPDVNAYGPTILHDDGSYNPDTTGADEIRELQRAFPQTNWPSSMRYYERP